MRLWAWAVMLVLGTALAADEPQPKAAASPLSSSAEAGATTPATTPAIAPAIAPESKEAHGVSYTFSLAQWDTFNGEPLSYTPFELGWAFASGWRVQTAIDLFYYEGMQLSKDQPPVLERYTYNMVDWRTSLLYRVPWSWPLRPLGGITLESVGGSRRLTPNIVGSQDLNATAPSLAAWSFFGVGAQLGLEWLFSRNLSLLATARYVSTLSSLRPPLVLQTGLSYVF